MAIKDWKETISYNRTDFRNKKRKLHMVINRRISSDDRRVRYDIYVFKEYDGYSKNPIRETFKTKQQALAYAKAYMRKH